MTKEIMKDLEEDEIEAIGQEITKLKLIPDDLVRLVHNDFTTKLDKSSASVVGGEQKFKELIKKSFGDEKAETFIDSMETKKGVPGEFLRRCDPKFLANVLRGEHPQTIALVLSTLGSKKAGDAIGFLPERIQTEVIMRMANLEKVDMSVLREVEDVLARNQSVGGGEGKQLGGVEAVATILNQMDRTLEGDFLANLKSQVLISRKKSDSSCLLLRTWYNSMIRVFRLF